MMCETEHGFGMVKARRQLANAEVDDNHRHSTLLIGLLLGHLLEVALLWNVSLKRQKLELAVLHFHSLKFFCTSSSLGFICY